MLADELLARREKRALPSPPWVPRYSRVALVGVLGLLLGAQGVRAASPLIKREFVFGGATRSYVLLDVSRPGGGPRPLLVLLHGSGRDGQSIIETWKRFAPPEGFVAVAPNSAHSSSWNMPADGPDFLRALVEVVTREFSCDPRRVYLFGHSGGAAFGLLMGLLESNYFAAVAVHAGVLQEQDAALVTAAMRKIPILLLVGDADPLFPVKNVEDTKELLSSHGFQPTLSVLKRHDHNYYKQANTINSAAWDFLATKLLPAPPEFQTYDIQ